jgi:hypothetical protein
LHSGFMRCLAGPEIGKPKRYGWVSENFTTRIEVACIFPCQAVLMVPSRLLTKEILLLLILWHKSCLEIWHG